MDAKKRRVQAGLSISALVNSAEQEFQAGAYHENVEPLHENPRLTPPTSTALREFASHSISDDRFKQDRSSRFEDLVREAQTHPAMALLTWKIFETVTQQEIPVPPHTHSLLIETQREHERLARIAGANFDDACSNSSLLDILFVTLSTAWDKLGESGTALEQPELRDTLVACDVATKRNLVLARPQTYSTPPAEYTGAFARALPRWTGMRASGAGRGARNKLSPFARHELDEWFRTHFDNPYPTDKEKATLATHCGISIGQVSNYFGNRRMRTKRKMRSTRNPPTSPIPSSPSLSPVFVPQSDWYAPGISNDSSGANVYPFRAPGADLP